MFKYLLTFVAACVSTYYLTDNSYTPSAASLSMREPSSVNEKKTRNHYDNLRCPSEAEFMAMSHRLNLKPIEGPSLDLGCKEKNNRNQLARVLALAKDIKFNFPKNWAPSVREEINNPFDYVVKNTKTMMLDLTQVNSVARNKTSEKHIELGGMFFKEEPLEAVSVLVHEARHSDPRDQGHTLCRLGDIPKTQGGCDSYFSNKAENAGAYGYGTLFDLALAQHSPSVDAAEKELVLNNALTTIGQRFNTFKSHLAKYTDIITVLFEDGSLAWIHPFTLQPQALNIQLPKFQEKIRKIEFSVATSSLLIFTESNRLFVWGPRTKITRPVPEAISEDDRFLHMSRQYVPFDSTYSYYTFLKTNGELGYTKYDSTANKRILTPYPLQEQIGSSVGAPGVNNLPNLTNFTLGFGMNSFFLDKQGLVYRARYYGNEPNFIVDQSIQSNDGGWKNVTGGVFYDDLILTDADGKLYQMKAEYKTVVGNYDTEEVVLHKEVFGFQAANAAKKYQQGLTLQGVLDQDGSLLIDSFRQKDNKITLKFDKKIIDFVVTRITAADSSIYKPANKVQPCGIQKTIETIGYGSVLGLNANGTLTSSFPNGTCARLLSEYKWTGGELTGVDSDKISEQPFPDSTLKLTSQNLKMIWVPYTKAAVKAD